VIRDFFLGFIKIHILHHAQKEEVYGTALMEELKRHGYDISPGTMYPTLHSLVNQGYLERVERVVEGKVRKYCRLTEKGREALAEAREKIKELVAEVMEDEN